jgi:tetratricopeptide (TPR) repeat protein
MPLDEGALDYAEYTFRMGPFSELKCAHTVAKHVLAAREYVANRQFSKAADEYRTLMQKAPQNIQWGFGLLSALYLDGQYNEALSYSAELFEYPDLIPAWEHRINMVVGDCYARLGDFVSARFYYEMAVNQAITAKQKDDAGLLLYASANPGMLDYILQGNEQLNVASRWYFEKAAQSAPDDFLPHYLLAESLIAERMYKEALQYIDTALSLEISFKWIERQLHYYRGICLFRAEDYDGAKLEFSEAIMAEDEYLTSIGRDDSVFLEVYRNWLDRCDWHRDWTPPAAD